ncbi:MAG: GNAT family N-acetyltransferase [Candidatus Zixiibacteriota bacterium]
MNRISIRKLKDEELKQAYRLVMNSFNALRRKNNLNPMKYRATRPDPFLLHLKRTDPDGCIGAFDGDRMVGYASAIIRDYQWYLAFLFVTPGKWNKGVGRKLLTRSLKIADTENIRLFSLCTFSYNPAAVALYSSFGMTPMEPIPVFMWPRDSKVKLKVTKPAAKLTTRIITDYEELGFINKLDVKNRGLARPEDHKFALDKPDTEVVMFYDGRRPVGYSVLQPEGPIAPISAREPQYLADMVNWSIRRQLERETKVILIFCPGSNAKMVQHLLKTGMKIREINLLMSNKRFGDLECYLPANLAIF